MTVLAAEIQKLICYTDQTEIVQKDVDDVVVPVVEAAIFDITKDIGAKNLEERSKNFKIYFGRIQSPLPLMRLLADKCDNLWCKNSNGTWKRAV